MPSFTWRRWQARVVDLVGPSLRTHGPALAGFTLLTIVLTYPYAFQATSAVRDAGGDPFLNAWVMAWNTHSFVDGNWSGFFDANMFFPAPKTSAYSEFLISQTLVAAPVLLVSGNPILAYNVALLAAMIATAFGAYLLGSYLNGRAAGFVAGIIFAFGPFMFDHLNHLQVLSAAGIPLAFLYLHKFFAGGRTRDLLLFSTCYVFQALANAYYATYLTLFAGLYILMHVVQRRRYLDLRFWRHMALHVGVSLVVLGPFFGQYLTLQRDFGFMSQRPGTPAKPLSFFATSEINRLYGEVTAAWYAPESALFPGAVALVLAMVGLWGGARQWGALNHRGSPWVTPVYRALGWGLVVSSGLLMAMLLHGGITASVFSIPVRANSFRNPIAWFVGLGVARLAMMWRYGIRREATTDALDVRMVYVWMLVLAVLLTFPGGPNALLYSYVPGFGGMRAVNRMHVMSMLAVAILASYGIAALLSRVGERRGQVVTGVLAALIVFEYLSVPVPAATAPVRSEIPAVHRWLAEQPEDFAFVEYPMTSRLQMWQVYFSAYHWKRSVTGASAYPSPAYIALRIRDEPVPSPTTLTDFEDIGIRFLIVNERPDPEVPADVIETGLARLGDRVRLVATLDSYDVEPMVYGGRARVFELTRSHWTSPQLIRPERPVAAPGTAGLDRSSWVVTAEPLAERAELAIDGDPFTRWHTGRQQAGDYFQVDLGGPTRVDGLRLHHAMYRRDYPRGYRIDVSTDGEAWTTAADNPEYLPRLPDLLKSRSRKAEIEFPVVTARYIRVTQTGQHDRYYWSLSEIEVMGSPGEG